MKKIILLFLISLCMCACSKDDAPDKGKLDSNATINLRPAPGTKAEGDNTHLSALEIVKQTTDMHFQYSSRIWGRGFAPAQRDTITPMLKMWGTDIIAQDGTLTPDFIESTNCVLVRIFNLDKPNQVIDTIAYIPNSVLRDAETKVKDAFSKSDFTTCYQLFNTAFTFIPITGPEWRALQAKGQQ